MSDIVADIRSHLSTMAPHQKARLTAEQLRAAADEIERLRSAIKRLAEQDATLSVCDGNVTVTVDATLTNTEREAVKDALDANDAEVKLFCCETAKRYAAALRQLLKRTS